MGRKKGFTVIELVVALGILGVIVAIVIPNVHGLTSVMKLTADVSRLKGNLEKAKSIAIKENRDVKVTINTDEYFIDAARVLPEDGISLSHNLSATGCSLRVNSRGFFDFTTTSADDPYIDISIGTKSKTISIGISGKVHVLN